MDKAFWLARWAGNRIGFHQPEGDNLRRRGLIETAYALRRRKSAKADPSI